MNTDIGQSGASIIAVAPVPRCTMTVRAAVAADVPFIDQLQKMHSHMVGWFPTKQIEKNVEGGHILIAEENNGGTGVSPVRAPRTGGTPMPPTPLGYIIARDQYMKRDDV